MSYIKYSRDSGYKAMKNVPKKLLMLCWYCEAIWNKFITDCFGTFGFEKYMQAISV